MAMTWKERMLATIRGEPTDRLPWVPRLDLWHKANRRAGTLPAQYADADLLDIVADLNWGFHAVVADFQDLRGPDDDADRALGIYNLWSMPWRTELKGVRRTVRVEGDRTLTEYRTPVGSVRTGVVYTEEMRRAGITITHVDEYAFKNADDYAPLGYIFEHAQAEENYAGYAEFAARIGERGLAVAFATAAASPMHYIQRELMPLDLFFYEAHDHPDNLRRLAEQVECYWDRMLAVVSRCPAEVILLGANYDASVTYPPFFAEHILPWLKAAAGVLHGEGKHLLTHTDGENTGLLEHYLGSEIDVADSICPAPMTKLSFREVRDAFAGRVTIMGGIPSVALVPASMSDGRFEEFVDGFFADIGAGDRLILGISDTTPPAADFNRLLEIARRAEGFGPTGPRPG
jgi:hypothetical protein